MGSASQGSNQGFNWTNALSNAWNAGTNQSTTQGFNSSTGQSTTGGQSSSTGQSSGQSTTGGQSTSTTGGQSTSTQKVWNPQTGVLEDIYAGADRLASGQGPMAGQVSGVSRSAVDAWTDALQPGGNPYFSASVQGAIDQATQSFKKGVLPELDARGVGAGSYGTSRDQLARGEAAGMFGQGVSKMVGDMYAQQYGVDSNARLTALGLAPQIQGTVTAPLTTAAGIVGGPTVLGGSQATNFGSSQGTNFGSSSNVATNSANATNYGQSTNSSVGSNFGQSTGQTAGGTTSAAQGAGTSSGSTGSVGILSK